MQLRPHVIAAAVLALAAPLSSCGFDYATDREYNVNSAAENREAEVDVLSAVVVSAAEGSGTFVASLSNNDSEGEQTFTGVSGDDGVTVETGEFEPIVIPPGSLVNLAEPPAEIVLTGEFAAGDVLPLAVEFGNGERVTLNVPVVADENGYWEGLDAS